LLRENKDCASSPEPPELRARNWSKMATIVVWKISPMRAKSWGIWSRTEETRRVQGVSLTGTAFELDWIANGIATR